MQARPFLLVVAALMPLGVALADDTLFRYEGDVLPDDPSTGLVIADVCDPPCLQSLEDGRFVLRWATPGDLANYHSWIAQPPQTAPPSLWVEIRVRSNHPLGRIFTSCDARLSVNYGLIETGLNIYGDAAISRDGGDAIAGLDIDEFHTYRFESLDGVTSTFAVDGGIFVERWGVYDNGYHYIQFSGQGGCNDDSILNQVHEWDFVRYGTIDFGERVVASGPPGGRLDARVHAGLDRFTVTFDAADYVYLHEISVETTGGDTPIVTQVRRRENDEPDTVEIVLDRPLPMGQTTRFTLDDGVAINVIEYTFAPGDTDGDGDVDLRELAAFQTCFNQPDPTGPCAALDLTADQWIALSDLRRLHALLEGPQQP